MGIAEAKKYIRDLHKKQNNPYLWPNFLTGLPDRAAVMKRFEEVFPKLGKYSAAYIRIANIQPYLIKYGNDRHMDIIQWAAAILKTTCGKGGFAGIFSNHDFVVICETKNMDRLIRNAAKVFDARVKTYYSRGDLLRKTTLSFRKNGEMVHIGLLKLIAVIADKKLHASMIRLLKDMNRTCEELERSGGDAVVLDKSRISGKA